MHRAHAHIADGQPLQTVNAALLAQHRVQVGQDLRRVLAPAVAAVDDGHAGPLGRFVRRALLEVAHHDHVAVELQHLDGVLDRLLVEVAGTRHLGIAETGDVPAQAVHGRFVRQARAGAGLIERGHQRLVLQQIAVLAIARDRLQPLGNLEHAEELLALELFQRQNVTTSKTTHCETLLMCLIELSAAIASGRIICC